jgi:L-iditol 2-dehydrogenase
MKALEFHGLRDLRIGERNKPVPGPGELLLRVTAVGVCGSDMHYYKEGAIGDAVVRPGFVMGHEFAGEVAALGEGVSPRDFAAGDIVAVEPAISCGVCEHCIKGNPNLCLDLRFAGQPPDSDGAMQEFVTWPADFCFKLPEGMTAIEGAIMEPLGVGLHAVDLGKIKLADTVLIIGAGPIGLSVLQFAKLSGPARIIVLDKLAYRLAAAREMGATDTLLVTDPENGDHVATVNEWTDGGANVVFEAAGDPQAMYDAVEMARRGARVVWVGIPPGDTITFHAHNARRKGLTLKLVRRMKLTYPRIISLVARGLLDARSMVTHIFALEGGGKAFDIVTDYADEVIKAVVQPGEPSK